MKRPALSSGPNHWEGVNSDEGIAVLATLLTLGGGACSLSLSSSASCRSCLPRSPPPSVSEPESAGITAQIHECPPSGEQRPALPAPMPPLHNALACKAPERQAIGVTPQLARKMGAGHRLPPLFLCPLSGSIAGSSGSSPPASESVESSPRCAPATTCDTCMSLVASWRRSLAGGGGL